MMGMRIYNFEAISALMACEYFQFKLIANEHGVVFIPRTTEHRDATRPNIKYADNYEGSALAAMVMPGVIEFRFHQHFSDKRVASIAGQIIRHPKLSFFSEFRVTYQNRELPC